MPREPSSARYLNTTHTVAKAGERHPLPDPSGTAQNLSYRGTQARIYTNETSHPRDAQQNPIG